MKHLGIFVFFATGGALFRFNETGIHLFEMLWMLILALLVEWLPGVGSNPARPPLAPALTVGLYYGVANERYLTQTEALVGLPLLASLWSAVAAVHSSGRRRKLWLTASGLAAGCVLVFKMVYVAIPMVWSIWLFASCTRGIATACGARSLASPRG